MVDTFTKEMSDLMAIENNVAVKSVNSFFMSFDLFNWFNIVVSNSYPEILFTKSSVMLNKIIKIHVS